MTVIRWAGCNPMWYHGEKYRICVPGVYYKRRRQKYPPDEQRQHYAVLSYRVNTRRVFKSIAHAAPGWASGSLLPIILKVGTRIRHFRRKVLHQTERLARLLQSLRAIGIAGFSKSLRF